MFVKAESIANLVLKGRITYISAISSLFLGINAIHRICLISHRPNDFAQYMSEGASPYDLHNPFWMASTREFLRVISLQLPTFNSQLVLRGLFLFFI